METTSQCGLEKATTLIGSKWVLHIMQNVCEHKKGFNELLRLIPGISPRILSLRLKELVESGLITKTVLPTTPPQVEYAVTAKGTALKSVIRQLADWADTV
jgi:DNA-binding HxlR family transcriptional regulator